MKASIGLWTNSVRFTGGIASRTGGRKAQKFSCASVIGRRCALTFEEPPIAEYKITSELTTPSRQSLA
jgi:hypothetical protein